MSCDDAQELLSVLYDGEAVPAEFAAHVDECPNCREGLRAYSQIGAELRLLASRRAISPLLPAEVLFPKKARRSHFASFADRIAVPKLAVAAAAMLFLAMGVGLISLGAQQTNPHLWFVFTLTKKGSGIDPENAPKFTVQTGYDDISESVSEPNAATVSHVAISSVRGDRVEMAARARFYGAGAYDAKRTRDDLKDLDGWTFTYRPGESLEIPIEGGGTLILDGDVLDHKPRFIGMGLPLEPETDELILTYPVLIGGDKVLARFHGTAWTRGPKEGVVVYSPGIGQFQISTDPRPGAVEGMASWSQLDFTIDGKPYSLLNASQISGGNQPRTLWVTLDANYVPNIPNIKGAYLGAGVLTSLEQNPHR